MITSILLAAALTADFSTETGKIEVEKFDGNSAAGLIEFE